MQAHERQTAVSDAPHTYPVWWRVRGSQSRWDGLSGLTSKYMENCCMNKYKIMVTEKTEHKNVI